MNVSRDQLATKISLLLDGDLSAEETHQLEDLLTGDPQAQEVYLDQLGIHSDLLLLSSQVQTCTEIEPHQTGSGQPVPSHQLHPWLSYGLVGLGSSILTLSLLWVAFAAIPASAPTTPPEGAANPPVAVISRKVDCDWEGDRWDVVASSHLHAGQTVSMSRGLMELEFSSGARVTLEAPVLFRVESPLRGVLSYGKLTAEVPEPASGFTVSTPDGETIDLGTKFGLWVAENGATETHVFDGEVMVRPSGADAELHLTDQMAARYGDTDGLDQISAVPQRFAHLNFDTPPSEALPVDRELVLWLAADHGVQLDEQNGVVAWGDLVPDSNGANHAWQVEPTKRPRWVEQGVGGHPAVRFSGKQFMVTEPMSLGLGQSVVVVFQLDLPTLKQRGVNAHTGRQLLNFNGPPHLVLGVNDENRLVSRVFAGVTTTADQQQPNYRVVGRTQSPAELNSGAMVVAYVYNPRAGRSDLYLNGARIDTGGAPSMEPTRSPRYIGSHMFLSRTQFLGDIAELMIFDTGLNSDEVLALSAAMIDKYGISPSVPNQHGNN